MDSSWDYNEVKIWSLTGSIYTIMSIFSSGWWFSMFTETTTNSSIFVHYLVKMNDWIYNIVKIFVEAVLDKWRQLMSVMSESGGKN